MNKNLLSSLLFASSTLLATSTMAAETDHNTMDHAKHMTQMSAQAKQPASEGSMAMLMTSSPLIEPGNDAFGTIQEVILLLDADPNTDWGKVDLEALRQHLVDMKNFTYDVNVLSQTDLEKGSRVVIQATTDAAGASLSRALSAHPAMLESETGWRMSAMANGKHYILTIETDKPREVNRLRALGYIGVMALGNHHQVHHWLMARGDQPHGG